MILAFARYIKKLGTRQVSHINHQDFIHGSYSAGYAARAASSHHTGIVARRFSFILDHLDKERAGNRVGGRAVADEGSGDWGWRRYSFGV